MLKSDFLALSNVVTTPEIQQLAWEIFSEIPKQGTYCAISKNAPIEHFADNVTQAFIFLLNNGLIYTDQIKEFGIWYKRIS